MRTADKRGDITSPRPSPSKGEGEIHPNPPLQKERISPLWIKRGWGRFFLWPRDCFVAALLAMTLFLYL